MSLTLLLVDANSLTFLYKAGGAKALEVLGAGPQVVVISKIIQDELDKTPMGQAVLNELRRLKGSNDKIVLLDESVVDPKSSPKKAVRG